MDHKEHNRKAKQLGGVDTLSGADILRLNGYCRALLEHIRRTNFALIPYETLVSLGGARAPARMHQLKELGFIEYETVRRKGANVYDYRPLPKKKEQPEQMTLLSGITRHRTEGFTEW